MRFRMTSNTTFGTAVTAPGITSVTYRKIMYEKNKVFTSKYLYCIFFGRQLPLNVSRRRNDCRGHRPINGSKYRKKTIITLLSVPWWFMRSMILDDDHRSIRHLPPTSSYEYHLYKLRHTSCTSPNGFSKFF